MKCQDAHKEFLFLAEGTLSESKTRETEKHISECGECNLLYKNISDTFNEIQKEKITEINPFFFTRIEQKMKNKKEAKSVVFVPKLKRIVEPLMLAAVIAMGLFFGVLIGNNGNSQNEMANVEQEFAQEFYFDDNELAYQSIEEYLIEE